MLLLDNQAGAAYVMLLNVAGTTATLQQQLLPSTSDAGMQFGSTVAIYGNEIFVAAPFAGCELFVLFSSEFQNYDQCITVLSSILMSTLQLMHLELSMFISTKQAAGFGPNLRF